MAIQPIVAGGTYDWFLNPAHINTRASPKVYGIWDITGATVTISFMRYGNGPDAAATSVGGHFSATILSGTDGTAHYTNAAGLFSEGTWGVSWKVVVGSTVLESEIMFFKVKASGAAA
jgi:hypothetical protein